MKVLVSTVNYLLLVDCNLRKVSVVESSNPEYYGISWWGNSKELVLSHSGLDNEKLIDFESYVHSEKGYLSWEKTQSSRILSAPHQIICAPDDIIIATNTGRNCVTLYNTKNHFYKDIRVNDIYWDRLGKEMRCGEHFNSVFLKQDKLYVLAHRFSQSSYVYVFSYPECQLIEKFDVKDYSGMHNIWVDDNENLFSCNSQGGSLVEIKTNEVVWSSGAFNFTRGLAATEDYILLGDSSTATRADRKHLGSELWILDRKTFITLDYLFLGNYGGVHEVRVLDHPDEAHHNLPFTGIEELEKRVAEAQINNDDWESQKKAKIKASLTTQKDREIHKKLNFMMILNQWTVLNSWCSANELTLGLYTEEPKDNFTVSFEFSIPDLTSHNDQHLSLVLGYQGPHDTNMIALLFHYYKNSSNLALWINEQNNWQMKEILLNQIPKQGKISVSVEKGKFTLEIPSYPLVVKEINCDQLKGRVGMRTYGAQFKNFKLTTPVQDSNQFRKELNLPLVE